MKMLHNHFSPGYPSRLDSSYAEPLTFVEAVKTYLMLLLGVGISVLAFYYLMPF